MRKAVAQATAFLVTFTVKDRTPGTYVFWCSVEVPAGGGNHASNGMVGTLTVTP